MFDGKANYQVNWKDLDQGKTETFGNVPGWLGFTDKYWLTALVPPGAMTGEFRRSPAGGYQADYALAPTVLAPGQVATTQARLFAGAKEKAWLDRYEQAGIPKISKSIDWGWFEWFMRPIFGLLVFLFHTLGNFGVAIICLTLIVRGIMFPIAQKQFQSMAAMRKIQPKMKALQERYKDDSARQQQEIMKLYQEEKINPAAGCLPILLQIPVFYALYKVLMVSVEMRHQPFALWIHDLSAPDSASLLTLAHQFGWTWFPPFLGLSVLAILLGVTMWLQFKLNPQQMDPTQQQIFAIMPWVMMFIMAPVRQRPPALLGDQQRAHDRPAMVAVQKIRTAPVRHPPGPHMTGAAADEELAERARKLFAGPIAFLKSAPELRFLPDPDVPEIAFAGRSNVGKSSLLNALTNRKALARTSNTPGRTQELNFFDVGRAAPAAPRRHAGLWLRRGAEGPGQALALPHQRLSARPRGLEARAGADRFAPWPQGRRPGGDGPARRGRGQLPPRPHQGRQGQADRAGGDARGDRGRGRETARRASGGLHDSRAKPVAASPS